MILCGFDDRASLACGESAALGRAARPFVQSWAVRPRRGTRFVCLQVARALGGLACVLAMAGGATAAEQTKRSYRLVMGKGHEVCEAYLRNLRAFDLNERDPVCDPRPHPKSKEFLEPEWESMDVAQHMELVYRAEMSWGIYLNHPERHPPYDDWRREFESKRGSGEIQPRLKRATIEFVKGKPVTVLAYSRNPSGCEADFARYGASGNAGYHWFFYDETKQTLTPNIGTAGSSFAGAILVYRKRPYIINAPPTAEYISLYQTADWTFAAVEQCRYDVDDPSKPASVLKQRPFLR